MLGWLLYDLASVASLNELLRFLPLSWPDGILRDVPGVLADAVVCEAVVRGVDKECAHGVKFAAYLPSAVWDVYTVLAFAGMSFEDETVDVSVEWVTNDLATAEDLVLLKCLEVALVPTGFLVLIPAEVEFSDRFCKDIRNTLEYFGFFSCIYDGSNRSCHELICISFG